MQLPEHRSLDNPVLLSADFDALHRRARVLIPTEFTPAAILDELDALIMRYIALRRDGYFPCTYTGWKKDAIEGLKRV